MAIHYPSTRYAPLVALHLPHKTEIQVREKARSRKPEPVDRPRSVASEDEAGSPQGNATAAPEPVSPPLVLEEATQARVSGPGDNDDRDPEPPDDGVNSDTIVEGWKEIILREVVGMDPAPARSPALEIDRNIVSIARRLRRGVGVFEYELNHIVDSLTDLLKDEDLVNSNRTGQRTVNRQKIPNSAKARRYARTQNLMLKNPRELARIIEDDELASLSQDETRRPNFTDSEVRDLYGPLWGHGGDCVWNVPHTAAPVPPEEVWTPIDLDEVELRVKNIPRASAGGPDKIRKSGLLRVNGILAVLAKLYNVLLVTGIYPRRWLVNRTVLIPKAGKDPTLIGNTRPITIGSMLARIFSGLIFNRLSRSVDLSPRQKGFMQVNGTFENSFLLDEAIRASKSNRKDLVVLIIDIKRAFDSVPHEGIGGALRGAGMHADVVSRVLNMYKDVTTEFRTKSGTTELTVKRGVKQGDPLSPLLFNMVLDPLIRWLDMESAEGYGPLAYADDLVLLCKTPEEARLKMATIEAYLKALNMELSAGKCQTFWLHRTPAGSMRQVDPDIVTDDGTKIQTVDKDSTFTYLGVRFHPFKGLDNGKVLAQLIRNSERVGKLNLKPRQKLQLMYEYVIPRSFYRMAIDPPSKTKMKDMDKTMRAWVKSVLHLPPSTPNGLIHTKTRDGGLGLPSLSRSVWLAHVRALDAVLHSNDALMQFYVALNRVTDRLNYAADNWGIPFNDDDRLDVAGTKTRLYQLDVDRWKAMEATGHGVASFTDDRIGNRWLRDPGLLKESVFLNAVRLRANLVGTREALRRVDRGLPGECRKCGHPTETLMHILNVCPNSHAKVVRRHDEIKELIASRLSRQGWNVLVETPFEVSRDNQATRLRPDIVAYKDGNVRVVDVAVTYESQDALRRTRDAKVAKYSALGALLKERFHCEHFAVIPVVVGSRGALPDFTKRKLKDLGLSVTGDGLTMSLIALRSSIGIATRHLDN